MRVNKWGDEIPGEHPLGQAAPGTCRMIDSSQTALENRCGLTYYVHMILSTFQPVPQGTLE
jgi:hypothetical protein